MMEEFLPILLATLAGVLVGGLVSLFPSLHIYNVAGIALLIWVQFAHVMPEGTIAPFFMSLVVSFAFVGTIPMTMIGAPDESAVVTILPGTKYLTMGRGYEATVLTGIGCLIGVAMLALLTPYFFYLLPYLNAIASPHMHWILTLVMAYMLLSEWPKGTGRGQGLFRRLLDGWHNLFAGIMTFGLAGLMGIIITSKSIITPEMGFQNIMPVFVGLFAVPSVIQHLTSREGIPRQHIPRSVEVEWRELGRSAFQGSIGGALAAYLPAVTAGIGGILAGHATASRGDRIFIVSGGVMKVIYYVGAFLMLFILTPLSPNGLGKGGMNFMLKPLFSPRPGQYAVMLAVIILSGCLSYLLMLAGARVTVGVLHRMDYRKLYWLAGGFILLLIGGLTGWAGLFVMAVATCIGMIPVFFHARRSNCMAVLLVPIALNMGGLAEPVMLWMGLS